MEAAKILRDRGFALCKLGKKSKRAVDLAWTTKSKEAKDFRKNDLIGIIGGPLSDGNLPGHALVIIDIDDSVALEIADEYLPQTGMIEGRAGKPKSHRFFLVKFSSIPEWAHSSAKQGSIAAKEQKGHPGPFTKSFRNRATKKEIIKLLGTGGQVVCPPSLHPSGEVREWVMFDKPAVVDFVVLWEAVCNLCHQCGCDLPGFDESETTETIETTGTIETKTVKTTVISTAVISTIDRARSYLAKIPGAISGQAGHDTTFWAARAMAWGFDLGEGTAFQLLRDDFNSRCKPPWTETELRHKAKDADSGSFKHPRGYLLEKVSKTFTKPNHVHAPDILNGTFHPGGRKPPTDISGDSSHELPENNSLQSIILKYLIQTYKPDFKRENMIHARDGRWITSSIVAKSPDFSLREKLEAASDAPKPNKITSAFRDNLVWSWGQLQKMLPDEGEAKLSKSDTGAEEVRQAVRDALNTFITIGATRAELGKNQTEDRELVVQRKPLITWCSLFAKPGDWADIRGYKCWSKKVILKSSGEELVRVAIRHEVFAQLKADKRLTAMGANLFGRLVKQYGIGQSGEAERPFGQRAILLNDDLIQDLLIHMPLLKEDNATE